MDINNINVGIRIAETRKRRNYSREKLSELAEVSVQFLADIEKGRKTMTITTLRRVAAALNVTTDYIVNGTEAYSENVYINTMLNSLWPYTKQRPQNFHLLQALRYQKTVFL